jgi:hypothetical protein
MTKGQPLPAEIEYIEPPVLECADCGGPVPDISYHVRREPHPNITETLCYGCAAHWGGMTAPPKIEPWRLDWGDPNWRPILDEWYPIADCQGCGRARWQYDNALEQWRISRSPVCSQQCRRHVRRWTRRRAVEYQLTCIRPGCGRRFTAKRRDARTCSPRCRVAVHRGASTSGAG